ncbi:hypothetical protein CAOG_05218 [Capsaspora owczarzaki ATCC 30864]|uniref:hypothetical protein n=1 Tax=Capsaspora owczarzaki (strain ATCC 30864) TaxID=595528 RepID=UPI0001FE40ED|nr:hypothetical protein CAOG_05218 [Capsaspora owczarzaki ATCC 30864]|eukprot:XP_004346903.1 hypothetical protein CAOG_05218 [Capsaspora owczarzaki ATCC 30864]
MSFAGSFAAPQLPFAPSLLLGSTGVLDGGISLPPQNFLSNREELVVTRLDQIASLGAHSRIIGVSPQALASLQQQAANAAQPAPAQVQPGVAATVASGHPTTAQPQTPAQAIAVPAGVTGVLQVDQSFGSPGTAARSPLLPNPSFATVSAVSRHPFAHDRHASSSAADLDRAFTADDDESQLDDDIDADDDHFAAL